MKIWKQKDLIISLLKSKERVAELFNDNDNNLYDHEISDIRRILSRLRDLLPKEKIERKLKKSFMK